jgi:large subunit ribosomal protein L5
MKPRLKEKYRKEVIPKMREIFGYQNNLAVPKLEKVVINVGTGRALRDSKFMEVMIDNLKRITGQKPTERRAKKAISNFKIRKGLVIGLMVTLRGKRMYEFVDKLINVALPRVRDFRGLSPKGFDDQGNYTIGFKEHIVFPEIKPDEVEKLHGLEVSIVTNTKNKKEAKELLRLLGFSLAEK